MSVPVAPRMAVDDLHLLALHTKTRSKSLHQTFDSRVQVAMHAACIQRELLKVVRLRSVVKLQALARGRLQRRRGHFTERDGLSPGERVIADVTACVLFGLWKLVHPCLPKPAAKTDGFNSLLDTIIEEGSETPIIDDETHSTKEIVSSPRSILSYRIHDTPQPSPRLLPLPENPATAHLKKHRSRSACSVVSHAGATP